MSSKQIKKTDIILAVVVIICIIIAISGCMYIIGLKNKAVKAELNEIVENLNNQAPISVDEETRMVKAEALDLDTIKYIFDLKNLDTKEAKLKFTDPEKNNIKKSIIDNLKNNVSEDFFTKNKINFIYAYRSKTGEEVFTIEISYNDYK